jgi:hypothetical protein
MAALTRHAEERARDRAVPPIVLDWLFSYGQRAPAGDGAECLFFNKSSRRILQRELGGWAYTKLEPKFDAYAILASDGAIITTGYRHKKIRRK